MFSYGTRWMTNCKVYIARYLTLSHNAHCKPSPPIACELVTFLHASEIKHWYSDIQDFIQIIFQQRRKNKNSVEIGRSMNLLHKISEI